MIKYLIPVIFLVLALALTATAQLRVGYMDPQAVLDRLPEKDAIERQLNRFLDNREAEFEQKFIAFQNELTRFQEQAENLTEAESRRRQQELQAKDQELSEFQMSVQRELEQRQAELLGPILQEMNTIIESLAREMNLDYVLNQATSEGEMFLMFVSDEGKENLDLTEKVISRMLN